MPMTNLLAFACWPGYEGTGLYGCGPVAMADSDGLLTFLFLLVVVSGFILWLRRRV